MKEAAPHNIELIESDDRALLVARDAVPRDESAIVLHEIAVACAREHSFVDHQTYPRSLHPNPEMRLSELFTFASVIVSLRTTLGIEMGVTRALINATHGNDDELLSLTREQIADIVRPSGLAENKAAYITEGLDKLSADPDYAAEILRNDSVAETRKKLLKLKGVGSKAVDCFMLLGLNMPVFPVDVNVFRVVTRNVPEVLGADVVPSFDNPHHTRKVKEYLEQAFAQDVSAYQVLHTYLLLAEKYRMASRGSS